MDLKEIGKLISQIAKERQIPEEKVLKSFEGALASAWKKELGKKGQKIEAKFDLKTGRIKFWRTFLVVKETEKDKIKFNPEKQITLKEARKINPQIKEGEELKLELKEIPKEFGRIASQTAKQVLIQKIREVEKETLYEDFKKKEGEIVSGIVQRVEAKKIVFDLGRTIGTLPKSEQIPNEFYRPGQRLKAFVLKVEKTPKGPEITLSRVYPKFVSKLFELEVPEIQTGQVEIKSIAREAGSRTKIAVASKTEGIDPIGSCVGQRGVRVQAVISELGGEKIDIVEYSHQPEKYITNALSPAKILEVKILPKNKALAIVPDDQLSLAIGRDGQNVRLAAKLTNWKIDVKSKSELEKENLEIK